MDDNHQPVETEKVDTTPEQMLQAVASLPFPKYQRHKLTKDVQQYIDEHNRVPSQEELRDMIKSACLLTPHGRANKGTHTHAAMIKYNAKRKMAKRSRRINRGK